MKLDRVTITGADNSIPPSELLRLSLRYPFVEWGILVSRSNTGKPRYPSLEWISELQDLAAKNPKAMSLSLHVCGRYVREILMGNNLMPWWMLSQFQRVQLNFHGERTPMDGERCWQLLFRLGAGCRQFIFQIDGAQGADYLESLWEAADNHHVDSVPLYDVSGGAGVLPAEWPKAEYMETDAMYAYHGYAGGLGPDNLTEQIPRIAAAAGEARFWIDMETKVRRDYDRIFNLFAVESVLTLCEPYVSPR